MAWCHQTASHYLIQGWPRSVTPYGVIGEVGSLPLSNVSVFYFSNDCQYWLTHCGLVTPLWWQRSGSILGQVMARWLMAPNRYLFQCWFLINEVHWQSPKGNFTTDTTAITKISRYFDYQKNQSNLSGDNELKLVTFPRDQWVNVLFQGLFLSWKWYLTRKKT